MKFRAYAAIAIAIILAALYAFFSSEKGQTSAPGRPDASDIKNLKIN